MREKSLDIKRIYDGRIVSLELHEVELDNGVRTAREVVRHRGAVAILPRLPDGRFVLVRQFRKPVEDDLLEVVAGNCERGEDPAESARRELMEETGYAAKRLEPLGAIYPSPGYVDERIEIFFAEIEDQRGGVDFDHDEHIETVILTYPEIEALVLNGGILDSKTLAALYLYEKAVKS